MCHTRSKCPLQTWSGRQVPWAIQHRVHIFPLGGDAILSVGWFEAARGRYVTANTSSAKGDGCMPATNVSRYRLASPSATGMQSGLCAVQTVLSLVLRAEQTASLCLRATTMRPRSSVTSVKFWTSGDSLCASNGRTASLWTFKYACSNKCAIAWMARTCLHSVQNT